MVISGQRFVAAVRPFSTGRRDQHCCHLLVIVTAYSYLALCNRIFDYFCYRCFVLLLLERTIFFCQSPNGPNVYPLCHYLHDKFHAKHAIIDFLCRDIGNAADHCAPGRFGCIYADKFFQL